MASKKILVSIFCILSLSSCYMRSEKAKKGDTVRIVDAEGNPVSLERRMPVFNQKQIEKQKDDTDQIKMINNDVEYNQQNLPDEIFADKPSQKTQTTVTNLDQKKEDKIILGATDRDTKLKQKTTKKGTMRKQTTPSQTTEQKRTTEQRRTTERKQTTTQQSAITEKGPFYIQIGAYKSQANASKSLKKYEGIANGSIKSYKNTKGQTIYRTILGPYSTKSKAEADLDKVIQRGHYDVYITKQ